MLKVKPVIHILILALLLVTLAAAALLFRVYRMTK